MDQYGIVQNPDVSSIRMSAGTSVRIYSEYNFAGQQVCVSSDVAFLGNMGGYNWNDSIRSMIVYSQTGCQ